MVLSGGNPFYFVDWLIFYCSKIYIVRARCILRADEMGKMCGRLGDDERTSWRSCAHVLAEALIISGGSYV